MLGALPKGREQAAREGRGGEQLFRVLLGVPSAQSPEAAGSFNRCTPQEGAPPYLGLVAGPWPWLPDGVTAVWAPADTGKALPTRPQGKVASTGFTAGFAFAPGARAKRLKATELWGPVTNKLNSRRLQMKYRHLQTNLTPEKEKETAAWNFLARDGKTASWRQAEGGGLLRAARDRNRGSREAVSDAASCPSPPLGPLWLALPRLYP